MKKKKWICLILVTAIMFSMLLTSCGTKNEEMPNTMKPEAEGEASAPNNTLSGDSITYLCFNGKYMPLSWVEDGCQRLFDGIEPHSVDLMLKDAPTARDLPKIDVPEESQTFGIGPIASNGDWDFFPEPVAYQTYSINEQPDEPDWMDYFKQKLSAFHYDGPVLIRESTKFQWNGVEMTIVTASNVVVAEGKGEEDLLASQELCSTAKQPGNKHPVIYTITALFSSGNYPYNLFQECREIYTDQERIEKAKLAFTPWQGVDSSYLHYLSVYQYDESGNIDLYPILCDYGVEFWFLNFRYPPNNLICDIDGDGMVEVVFNTTNMIYLTHTSKVFKLNNEHTVSSVYFYSTQTY